MLILPCIIIKQKWEVYSNCWRRNLLKPLLVEETGEAKGALVLEIQSNIYLLFHRWLILILFSSFSFFVHQVCCVLFWLKTHNTNHWIFKTNYYQWLFLALFKQLFWVLVHSRKSNDRVRTLKKRHSGRSTGLCFSKSNPFRSSIDPRVDSEPQSSW